MPSLYEQTKESLSNAADYAKDSAESAKETLFGEKNVEDRAADRVKDAADWTADTIGEARQEMSDDNNKPLLETVKDKLQDAFEYTKEAAHNAKESAEQFVFGESTSVEEHRGAPVFAPRENVDKTHEMFKEIRKNNEDTDLPHVHDY